MNTELNTANIAITNPKNGNAQYPSIAKLGEETYISWQDYRNGHDDFYAGNYVDGQLDNLTLLSQGGEVFRPAMHAFADRIWFVWAECTDSVWTIYTRWVKDGIYSDVTIIDQGMAVYNQSISNDGENIIVLWSRQGAQFSHAMMAVVTIDGKQQEEIVSISKKAYRPTACVGNDNRLYVTYDIFDGKAYHAMVRIRDNGQWSEEVQLNDNDDMWVTQPIVAPHENGAIMAWYDFGKDGKLSFVSSTVSMDTKINVEPMNRFTNNVSWYQDMDTSYNDNYVATVYTWGKYNIHLRIKENGKEWSAPVVMSTDDGHCAVHPKVIIDSDNMIHVVWQFAPKNGHYKRNAHIMYNTIHVDEMVAYYDVVTEKERDGFTSPVLAPKMFEKPTQDAKKEWLAKNGYADLTVAFGDIHGQSGISDGAGQIDQYYNFALSTADLEFASLTDHDCYPDWTSKSEWEWMRTACRLANLEDNFASLLSYEWTPNEYKYEFGHKNIYYPTFEGEMFRSGDAGGMTPVNLFESIKEFGGQCIPHHPAAMWGMVSAATDWDFHDDKVQRLVEIFSRHAPYEKYEDTSIYTKDILKCEDCCVQDALARKYKLGVIAGSDSHQMEHGIEGGILGAFLPSVEQKELFDAMYNRFVFGTTGARILPSIKIGDAVMGQEITKEVGEKFDISVSALCTQEAKIELIKNNLVIDKQYTDQKICDFTFTDTMTDDGAYYYIRITQIDEHMAWTSPIWVEKK